MSSLNIHINHCVRLKPAWIKVDVEIKASFTLFSYSRFPEFYSAGSNLNLGAARLALATLHDWNGKLPSSPMVPVRLCVPFRRHFKGAPSYYYFSITLKCYSSIIMLFGYLKSFHLFFIRPTLKCYSSNIILFGYLKSVHLILYILWKTFL